MTLDIIKIKSTVLKKIVIVINIKILNKKSESHIYNDRNSYPATLGGAIKGYSYGNGGNSNASDNNPDWHAKNGNKGAVIFQYTVAEL